MAKSRKIYMREWIILESSRKNSYNNFIKTALDVFILIWSCLQRREKNLSPNCKLKLLVKINTDVRLRRRMVHSPIEI